MRVATWLSELPPVEPVPPSELEALRDDLDHTARRATALVAEATGEPVQPGALRLPKSRLAHLDRCERTAVAAADDTTDPGPLRPAVLKGIALDRYVIHQLRAGRVLEPVNDLRAMLQAEAEWAPLAAIDELEDADVAAPAALFDPLATSVAEAWEGVGLEWSPRAQSRATLGLADARVLCSGVVDVELGGGSTGRPGVVVEVKSGSPNAAHLAEVALYALLVALRDDAAPAYVARWYPRTAPAATAVTLGVLESAARRLSDGIIRWAELRAGRPPNEVPGSWCAWCPDAAVCPSAQPVVARPADRPEGDDPDPDDAVDDGDDW